MGFALLPQIPGIVAHTEMLFSVEWLFELLLPSCQIEAVWPFCSDLSYPQNISFLQNRRSMDVFVLWSIWSKLERLVCVRIQRDQQFLKHSKQPVWHQQSCHRDHRFFPFCNCNPATGLVDWINAITVPNKEYWECSVSLAKCYIY